MRERKGPSYAILFGRLEHGRRFIANAPDDARLHDAMVERAMIGQAGRVMHTASRNMFAPEQGRLIAGVRSVAG